MKQIVLMIIISIFMESAFSNEAVEVMRGYIYRKGTQEQDLMYVQKEIRQQFDKAESISHQYYGADNELEAFETVKLENGVIDLYETAINGLNFEGSLQIKENSIKLMRVQDGKFKEREIRIKENLIVGPMLPSFVEQNADDLMAGEKVVFYLPFFDGMTLIPMVLEAKDSRDNGESNTFTIEMKLKSRLLSLFIDTIDMVLDKNTGKIVEIHGPTILPDPVNSSSREFVDANIYYEYGGI